MNISDFTNNLSFKHGIYFSNNKKTLSYPQNGYDRCFEIEDISFWFRHRNECILTIINNYPPVAKIIIDLGGEWFYYICSANKWL